MYFLPKKNEIFPFRQAVKQPNTIIDQFVTRLQQLEAHCEFQDPGKERKSAIIQNCQAKHLRRYALREEALTLDNLLAKAHSLDASELQATGIEKSLNAPDNVNRVQQKQHMHQTTGSQTPTPASRYMPSVWINNIITPHDNPMPSQRRDLQSLWETK